MMYKVIVVEDENRIREGFLRLLNWKSLGFEIIGTARNGKEGLVLLNELKPDLAFIDINMPVMSGLEMIKNANHKDYAAVIISGYDEFNYAQEALKLGAFDYLLKPVLIDDLMKVLNRFNNSKQKFIIDSEINKYLDKVLKIPATINDTLVQEIIQSLERELDVNYSTKEIAEMYHVSISRLNGLFTNETGHSFHKFHTRYRVRKSMELLFEDDLFIYEIGEKVGFYDYKYFGKIFKTYVGMTVSEFKEEINFIKNK